MKLCWVVAALWLAAGVLNTATGSWPVLIALDFFLAGCYVSRALLWPVRRRAS